MAISTFGSIDCKCIEVNIFAGNYKCEMIKLYNGNDHPNSLISIHSTALALRFSSD